MTLSTRMFKDQTFHLCQAHADLFDRAHKMYLAESGMDEIMNLLLEPKSAVWFDSVGLRVPNHLIPMQPIYQAIKAMARARGVAMGLLGEGTGTQPSLDEYEAKN